MVEQSQGEPRPEPEGLAAIRDYRTEGENPGQTLVRAVLEVATLKAALEAERARVEKLRGVSMRQAETIGTLHKEQASAARPHVELDAMAREHASLVEEYQIQGDRLKEVEDRLAIAYENMEGLKDASRRSLAQITDLLGENARLRERTVAIVGIVEEARDMEARWFARWAGALRGEQQA